MELKTITPASSILFLGAGFSLTARNIANASIPGGLELEHAISHLLQLPTGRHRLSTLASHATKKKPQELYELLYRSFTCATPAPVQSTLLTPPWLRIYTTNYDDVAEVVQQNKERPYESFTLNDRRPSKLREGTIIHLHGCIRELSPENISTQVVLSDEAYAGQVAVKSRWFDDFVQDIRYSDACFFIGYSVSDHHVAALLLEDPVLAAKLYFVVEPNPDPLIQDQLADKGTVLPIGLDGFVDLLKTLPPAEPKTIHAIRALRYLDPRPIQVTTKPTAIEISNLFRYGNFHFGRCAGTLPNIGYVTPRKRKLQEAQSKLNDCRSLILHSRLGNGKTIFSDILAITLAQAQYTCFRYRGVDRITESEIKTLNALEKLAIIFDSVLDARQFIATVAERIPKAKLILCYRTGVFDVRLEEIENDTPKPFWIVDLNQLDHDDLADLTSISAQSGLQDFLSVLKERRTTPEFRDLLIKAYQSRHITREIQNMMSRAFNDNATKTLFIAALLLKRADMRIEPHLLRQLSGSDIYSAITRGDEFLREVFASDDEGVAVRSSVFSEFVMGQFVDTSDILDVVFNLTLLAQARREQEKYRLLSGWLMQFSNINAIAKKESDHLQLIGKHYERLRAEKTVNKEPLFWLQYAIFMVERDDLNRANEFINAAYARAEAFPGFKSYQIDTQAFRIRVLSALQSASEVPEEQYEEIIARLEQMRSMVESANHRYFVIRTLTLMRPFIEKHRNNLEVRHKNLLVFNLRSIEKALGKLPIRVRTETASDKVRADLEAAIRMLTAV